VVAGQAVAAADALCRSLHDVRARAVGLEEVEVRGGEVLETVPEVAGQRHRLQEHLGQQHGRAHVEVDAAAAQTRHLPGEAAEIQVCRAPERARVTRGVHVHDVGADRHVDGRRQTQAPGGSEQARLEVAGATRDQVAAQRGADAEALAVSLADRPVDLLAGFTGHPEGPGVETRRHVLRGPSGDRQLEVVNDAGAVQRDAAHEAAPHQVDDDRRQAHLQDVRTHAPEDGLAEAARPSDLAGQLAQRLAGEYPRQRREQAPG